MREKYRAKNGSLRNTSTGLKGATFVIDHASAPVRKERLSPTSKARIEARQNEFIGKNEVPDRVKSFREINSGEDRPRDGLEFIKPIRNGLRKTKSFIWSRLSSAETGLAGRKNGIIFHKEE